MQGVSNVGCAIAHAMVCELEARGERAMLLLLDGCAGPARMPLHDATWYALFYLLREIGTLRGTIGEFLEFVRTADSPAQQLKLVNAYRPEGLSAEQWDAAVYTTLDRATLLKRLAREANAAAAARTTAQAGPSRSTVVPAPARTFHGPVSAVLPRDRLGLMFLDAARACCPGEDVDMVPLDDCRHTECLLTEGARAATAQRTTRAIVALLERIA